MRLALTAVLLTLMFGSPVSAEARNGIPSPKVTVLAESCPDGSGGPCANQESRTIYLPTGTSSFAREHELGHIFDVQYLSEGERNRFQTLAKIKGEWNPGTGATAAGMRSPAERFADAYAACRLGLVPGANWTVGYGYNPTRKQHRAVCGFLRRASDVVDLKT